MLDSVIFTDAKLWFIKLLSMDAFQLLSAYGGNANIRVFQQEMNRKYETYIGIMPCDGIYGRNTNTAFLYALQAEEGLPIGVANGNFGPKTKECCPTIPYSGVQEDYNHQTYTTGQIAEFTKLFKFGLYVNGFGDGNFSGSLDSNVIKQCQSHHALPQTGIADIQTWMSLMVSCGDDTRPGTACDTRFEITPAKLAYLQSNGYQYVGRYITGGGYKEIMDGELSRIFAGGLRVFPIYQTSGTSASYFTYSKGTIDAKAADHAARCKGIPRNTIIYFSVDFDAMDSDITSNIIPYFMGVNDSLTGFRVGIYAPRNVCSRVASNGLSISSFVSDMSTGFSGNLGFKMPSDWAFDQIKEYQNISYSGEVFDLDKDIYSGRDSGFNSLAPYADSSETYVPSPPVYTIEENDDLPDEEKINGQIMVNMSNTTFLVHSLASIAANPTGFQLLYPSGYIYPGDVVSIWSHPNKSVYPHAVTYHHPKNGISQGYMSYVTGLADFFKPFHEYNSNGTNLLNVNKLNIGQNDYCIFETRKILDRLDVSGNPKISLPIGIKLAVRNLLSNSVAGQNNPHFMLFDYYSTDGGNTWMGVGDGTLNGSKGYVNLGLQFGGSPSQRAIW